ncbi:MAG TPA: hypothetical protein VFT95_00860, partial [Micromonosporaceae bacterium]|nr:hypothetical protein [Micromonosporaceae bacterium]
MSTLSPVDVPAAELTTAAAALKALAADPGLRAGFLRSAGLRRLLAAPASRYIVAADRPELWPRLSTLSAKGYRLGVEYVGEEVTDPAEIEGICREYLAVIAEADRPVQLGFDLSNVGLLVSRELAVTNTERILRAAAAKDLPVVISMERS